MAKIIISPDQDIYYQYSDGRDLLSAALIERRQLLQELENLASVPQETRTDGTITRFDITRGQTLLYELSLVTERIDTLIVLINGYAEKCSNHLWKLWRPNGNDLSYLLGENYARNRVDWKALYFP